MRRFRRWWWLLPLGLALAVVAFVGWAVGGPEPMPEALAALESDALVEVQTAPWLVFTPRGQEPSTGLILYPGGRVDPRAYAPAARAIAEHGFLVAIPSMPLNLAFLAPDRAAEVMAAYPGVTRWAVGGHSLGGAMAAQFADEQAEVAQGLVLWAAYPADGNDLSGSRLAVASIYGTRDGLATVDEIEASRSLLPEDTAWVPIEGGNHAQFGWYGPQNGDNPATSSREDQQAQLVAATLEVLSRISNRTP